MTRWKEESASSTDRYQKDDNLPEEGGRQGISGGENRVSQGREARMWPEGTGAGFAEERAQESPGNSLTCRFS